MALQQTMGLTPRMLKAGLDKYIDQFKDVYEGPWKKFFDIQHQEDIYYDYMQISGMGLASTVGEGEMMTAYDTLDQDYDRKLRLNRYHKMFLVSYEANRFNKYVALLPRLGKELRKSIDYRKDVDAADLLNNGFTASGGNAGPDGLALFSSSHTIYKTGGTNSNLISMDFDQDALRQMKITVDNFIGPDGLKTQHTLKDLVYPVALQWDVDEVLKSRFKPGSADNDINVVEGLVTPHMWKQLTDVDAYFGLTNCDYGLKCMENLAPTVSTEEDFDTSGIKGKIMAMYLMLWEDWRLGVGSAGT